MNLTRPIEYEKRTVAEWLEALLEGSLALPRFQRSYVWTRRKTRDLIIALLGGRPVGTMLLIDRYDQGNAERFTARALAGTTLETDKSQELILDGQQRLTSLWHSLNLDGGPSLQPSAREASPAFLDVTDLTALQLEARDVTWPHPAHAQRLLADPQAAFSENRIPLSLFHPRGAHSSDVPDADRLRAWCINALPGDSETCWLVHDRISQQLRRRLLERNVWFAKLPIAMSRSDAIEVFVKVNESAAVIRKFDIAVAEYDRASEHSLRDVISVRTAKNSAYEAFFGADEQKCIPRVGELILKIACLQENLNPTDGQFTEASVLGRIKDESRLSDIFEGIEWAFKFLAHERVWTSKWLPSSVPMRVLPALYPSFRSWLDQSDGEGSVLRMLRAYLWRSFVTDRYRLSANTRLKQDYDGLRRVFERPRRRLCSMRALKETVPVFKEALPSARDMGSLDRPLAPPTRKNSLSRALLVASLQLGAKDFGSGQTVSAENVRGREAHHLFPRDFLKEYFRGKEATDKINHCLNYALVSGSTNRRMAAKSPLDYLRERFVSDPDLKERELTARVESHLVPYADLAVESGREAGCYGSFLVRRARLMSKALERLTAGMSLDSGAGV